MSVVMKDYRLIPAPALRLMIRLLLRQRIKTENDNQYRTQGADKINFIQEMMNSPIVLSEAKANEQHYQVSSDFFKLVLGKNLKYSCNLWTPSTQSLTASEENMLATYCHRARIENGQTILDLGCGWGALSLYLAEKFPDCQITALSNSPTQKQFIENELLTRKLNNVQVITENVTNVHFAKKFDRIISIEMFEHMRNYKKLLANIHQWMLPEGLLFIQYFCHRQFVYAFTANGATQNWLANHFFTDGIMPSEDLLLFFQENFIFVNRWQVNGMHYKKTCEAWHLNHLKNKKDIISLFEKNMLQLKTAAMYWKYWQIFFLACAELFGYNQGNEWFISHYLLRPKR